jgi:Zn-dependent protease
VPIRVHFSFALWIFLILANANQPGFRPFDAVLWVVFLFSSVTFHELSHSLVARHLGLKVRDIVLLPFGGVSQIEGMDASPQIEGKVAIAGPLASVFLGGVLLLVAYLVRADVTPTLNVNSDLRSWPVAFGWLNFLLAGFNMLPALPMDGGRVLRSLLARSGNLLRATKIATGLTTVIGIGMIALGLSNPSVYFILILIGGFILFGASSELRFARVRSAVQTLTVAAIVNRDPTTVPASVPVSEVAGWLWHFPGRAIPVVDDAGRYVGIVSMRDLAGAAPTAPVGSACDRLAPLLTVDMPIYPVVAQAFQDARRHELAVADAGHLIGILYLAALNDAVTRAQEQAGVGSRS